MKFLMLSIGLNDDEKKEIESKEPNFYEYDEISGIRNIELLRSNGCSNRTIKHIVVSNPSFLNNIPTDTKNLIEYIHKELKIRDFNDLFSKNPYLLSKEVFELEDVIKNLQTQHKDLKTIKELIKENPLIIEEN